MLFGYTNPDILSRHQNEIKDEYYKVSYTVPWLQSMDNFKIKQLYQMNLKIFLSMI